MSERSISHSSIDVRGGRAAAPRKLAIDDDDIQPLPRESFRDQRSRDAAADDQRIAFDVLGHLEADRMLGGRKPRRAAAAQIGLFGVRLSQEC